MAKRPTIAQGIARGSVLMGAEQVIAAGLGALFLVLFVRQVGSEDFGLWSIAYAAATIAAIATTGLHVTLERFLPEYLERGETARGRWLVRSVLALKLGLGLLAGGALAALAPVIASSFDEPGLTVLIRLLAAWLAADSLASFGRSLVLGLQDFYTRLAGTTLQGLVNVGAALAAVAGGGGVVFITCGFLLSTLAGGVLQTALGLRLLASETRTRTAAPAPASAEWGRLLRYGLPLSASGALFQVYLSLAKLVLGYMVGPQGTGVFSFASGILERATGLSGSATSALLPSFSRLMARADLASLRRYGPAAFRFSVVLAAATTVALFAFAREISIGLGGSEFEGSAVILQILSFQALLRIPSLALSSVLYALEAAFAGLVINAGKLAVEFALYVLLIPPFAERGAAVVQVAAYGLVLAALWLVLRRRAELRPGEYATSLAWSLAIIAPALLAAGLVDQREPSLLAGALVKGGLLLVMGAACLAPLALRSPRTTRGGAFAFIARPWRAVWTLDAEGGPR